jgi:hypothetical protein
MTPAKIVDRLELVIGLNGTPRKLVTAIERELVDHFGLVAIQASERAERLGVSIARIISERTATSETAGLSAALVIIGSTSDIVAGSCYVLSTDDPAIAAAKQYRAQIQKLLEGNQEALVWRFREILRASA